MAGYTKADTVPSGTALPEPQEPNRPDILHLVLEAKEFSVWIDQDIDVDWYTSDAYDKNGPRDSAKHHLILNRAAALECIPNDHHKKTVRLNFKRMIGEAVARSLKHDYDGADIMLDEAHAFITRRNTERARFWQLNTACGLGAVSAGLGLSLWTFRSLFTKTWGDSALFLVLAGLAGSLGALLSMVLRMGSSYPTSEAPFDLHALEAISRMFAGCISGCLIVACIQIGLILPALADGGHIHLVMVVAAVTAGASERWAPSLMAKIEARAGSPQKTKRT